MRGRLLNGRYELLERIGAGGMGEVWRARDQSLGREVAVKLFLPSASADESEGDGEGGDGGGGERGQLLARFRQEARAAASLDSPHIVAVHDHGTDGSTPYLVMALVQGRSLDQVLRESVRVPVADALRWAADICRALDAAHSAGVVHRDIKPGNVMIAQDGAAKVVDFGIATFMERTAGDSRLTQTGQLPFGSVPYLAPERFRQEAGDGRTDLYALGCVLYELLVGHPPFTGSAAGVMYNHVNDAPLRPSRARSEVTAPVERLVLDLLAKDPADRPADAATVLERIVGAAGSLPQGAREAGAAEASAYGTHDTHGTHGTHGTQFTYDTSASDVQDSVADAAPAAPAAPAEDARPNPHPPLVRKESTAPDSAPGPRRRSRKRVLITAALVLAVSVPTGLGIRSLTTSGDAEGAQPPTVYKIGVAHSYTHVGAGGSGGTGDSADEYEKSEYKQFTTQQIRTVESAFSETLGAGAKSGSRFRLVPVAAAPDTPSRKLLAEHPDMLAVIGDTSDFAWVHDTDEAFLPEIATCSEVAQPAAAFAIPADEARQGEAMAEYLLTRTKARRVLVAETDLWANRADGIGTALRKAGLTTKALDTEPYDVKTSQIPALVDEAQADAVVLPVASDIGVWAKKLRSGGFTGPVLAEGDSQGICEDSEERAKAAKIDKAVPDGVLRTRSYSGEPDDNLPARGNQELYDGALALATALKKLPADAPATSLRHTLDREIQNVSVNGVLGDVSFEKRRSARNRPVWFDRRDGDQWSEIGKVEGKFEPTKQ
ncbi:bifunctional serine/threonine-protein kinase/ABC transporter substrate-binding protein [Streptomyces sp. NPDC056486]|uniref:bifunctional serine/threonine-protein kinase/ABC transporter substrate-binding protein n=1 Tax=Streptomyces sp. NPDC056486 TaxID=3345835 RepID=UPI0036751EEE